MIRPSHQLVWLQKRMTGRSSGSWRRRSSAAARDGVKRAAGQPAEIDEEERIEDVVFVGGNHKTSISASWLWGKSHCARLQDLQLI